MVLFGNLCHWRIVLCIYPKGLFMNGKHLSIVRILSTFCQHLAMKIAYIYLYSITLAFFPSRSEIAKLFKCDPQLVSVSTALTSPCYLLFIVVLGYPWR